MRRSTPYLLVAPFFLLFLAFGAFPLLFTLWMALHDWELGSGTRRWVGLGNFRYLATDADFWHAVVNTAGIFALSTVPQLLAALVLADLLDRRLRGAAALRVALAAPLVTATAAVALVFTQLFDSDHGLVNGLLGLVGVPPVDWQGGRLASWTALAAMVDWRWTGNNALIYLAALQAVPRELYEAAALDGASPARRFWTITVPLLRPTIVFTAVVSTVGGLQLFTEPTLFGAAGAHRMDGGAQHQFQTVTMYLFESAFGQDRYGYGAAVAWALFLLIVTFALLNALVLRRRTGGAR
ncbi:carbohydrate ABC transporter permease [Actinomadura rayongensis]|uniref:ABC transporter permease subunit n=1 Tax=Actinomadura rayongensis TaxID=1429076 RepID=A0A6I4WBB3_9ACTN|nr:sugar ABC transporter permease [Actinomadura rayongensis]MXQ66393.1 ABC transporter permease subunit [Actinomadura rayongensis]